MTELLGFLKRKSCFYVFLQDKVSGEDKDTEPVLWNSLEGEKQDAEDWKTQSKFCAQIINEGRTERDGFPKKGSEMNALCHLC